MRTGSGSVPAGGRGTVPDRGPDPLETVPSVNRYADPYTRIADLERLVAKIERRAKQAEALNEKYRKALDNATQLIERAMSLIAEAEKAKRDA